MHERGDFSGRQGAQGPAGVGVQVMGGVPTPLRRQDWRPPRTAPILGDLATEEQRKKFEKLYLDFREGKSLAPVDQLWLLEAFQKLSWAGPGSVDWPQFAGLINNVNCAAYANRFYQEMDYRQTLAWPVGESERTIEWRVEAGTMEADMLVRPLLRPRCALFRDDFERLRDAAIEMKIDGVPVIRKSSIEQILIGPDGVPCRRHAFTFRSFPSPLFTAGRLDNENQCYPAPELGFMLVNGSQVVLKITAPEPMKETIDLSAWLVAARYTTKAN